MPKIIIDHPSTRGAETTYLTDDATAAETSIDVKNSSQFAKDDYVYVGEPGNEGTELRQISAITSKILIAVDALTLSHPTNTKITKADYNQVKIYRANSLSGTYTLIDTVDLDVDAPDGTVYDDTDGDATDYYKISYYNETSKVESSLTGAVPASGFDPQSVKAMIDDVSDMIGDSDNKTYSRSSILSKLNRWQDVWWLSPYTKRSLQAEDTLTTTASQNYILLSGLTYTFDKLIDDYSVVYNYVPDDDTDDEYCLHILTPAGFKEKYGDNTAEDSDDLEDCSIDIPNNKLLLGPTPESADLSITVKYFYKPAKLSLETDSTVCPIPSIITLGAAAEMLILKGEKDKAQDLMNIRNSLTAGEMEHRRTKGGSTRMRFRKDRDSARFK